MFITKERFMRVNERIRFSPVVVIDDEGVNLGSMPTQQALALAGEKGLDLVEIDPNSRPPICKIMDYGKHKYDLSKREKRQREKQKETELKEIRLTAKISDHDIAYKAKQAREFFNRGNKVRVTMRLRGRENVFADNAIAVFGKFATHASIEYDRQPVKTGNLIVANIAKAVEESTQKN